MAIWKQTLNIAALNQVSQNTAVSHLGIEFLEVGEDWLSARVPVNRQTCQPYGLLHGGVSVTLAETLGSCGAAFSVPEGVKVVGLDINANHLRGVSEGWVTGVARAVHLGRSTQVWQIDLRDDAGRMVCTSRLTMAVLPARD
jgi:1,4-dihydroxy-2-naphthoyl-CoA hydrolase